jgi:hypothetical protein
LRSFAQISLCDAQSPALPKNIFRARAALGSSSRGSVADNAHYPHALHRTLAPRKKNA